ncbi:GGDEF domain-containing protein [Rugamonas rubra]|uniref:diguanylate cyclase n=1 Tax=Rugamonas rubra TaxID=758825 RepID=A0A1I4QGE3_9BURK|nr:GGDEF domain-containing protein [Rugamonas rubra]SFM39129.1 diguanylate cyclase (GGDEF) domain-containing protein [Rugamonas rubra]
MNQFSEMIWHRLTGLMPGELTQGELGWLFSPHTHLSLLARRRAILIVNRVRLFAFLFAVLTPIWSVVDFVVFPFPLWGQLALMRFAACAAFASLLFYYRSNGDLFNAYRAIALLFAIPTLFYVASHTLLTSYQLTGMSAAIGAGYAFLPFVLLAGLAVFPLAIVESFIIASPILICQTVSGYLRWTVMDWPTFAGAFWLLVLITGVASLAGICQLAFMIALVRQAIRDPLTNAFSRSSGTEIMDLHFTIAQRNKEPFAVAFLDLDHFKHINDQFGHEAGDRTLIAMTESVTEHMRHGDVLVRWGGEEFLLIMPRTMLDQAATAIDRLRKAGFGERPEGGPVTASIGIAEWSADRAADWKQLVEIADQRMYAAKQGGRDRVVSGEPCPVSAVGA